MHLKSARPAPVVADAPLEPLRRNQLTRAGGDRPTDSRQVLQRAGRREQRARRDASAGAALSGRPCTLFRCAGYFRMTIFLLVEKPSVLSWLQKTPEATAMPASLVPSQTTWCCPATWLPLTSVFTFRPLTS